MCAKAPRLRPAKAIMTILKSQSFVFTTWNEESHRSMTTPVNRAHKPPIKIVVPNKVIHLRKFKFNSSSVIPPPFYHVQAKKA